MTSRIRIKARGNLTRKVPGQMSKTEAAYHDVLSMSRDAGAIADFKFESIRLKLADLTYYTPDFYVLHNDGGIELVEVKGSWAAPNQDKSRVKLKVAAAQYPEFQFTAVTPIAKKHGGGWEREEF